MPPYFAYAFALICYLAAACVVWAVAALLVISSRTRQFAKQVAVGMAGSFPGVFLFQVLAAPVVLVTLLLFSAAFYLFKPAGVWEVVCIVGLLLSTVGVIAVASVLGFYAGWRVAWEIAASRSPRMFILNYPFVGRVVQRLCIRFPAINRLLLP
jgi:hypothetical protein